MRQFYNFDYSLNFNGDLKKMATDVLEYSDIHLLVRGALVRSFVCLYMRAYHRTCIDHDCDRGRTQFHETVHETVFI